MTNPGVTVIDYGASNLRSVLRSLDHCGIPAKLATTPAEILDADRIILPGVGAFVDGMEGLRTRGLIEPIVRFAASDRPLLGICLGMQLLLDASDEFGYSEGLGIVPGKVVAIPSNSLPGSQRKIPHIGWNELQSPGGSDWAGTILAEVAPNSSVYFVHSFMALPSDPACRLADCNYGGCVVAAVLKAGNTFGCQFHPEKSGEVGLSILRSFSRLG
jgi:glutamine amidotransferase